MLHHRDFPGQTIERCLIELALAVGLFGLRFRAIEIAHHFGNRDDVSRIDLGFIFLGPARPHRALDAGAAFQGFQRALDQSRLRQLAHADIGDLRGRHPQRHLVLHEVDHEQFKLGAGNLLVFDGQDLANAVGWINHEFVGLEALTLGQNLFRLLDARRHCRLCGGLVRNRLDRRLDRSLGGSLGGSPGDGFRSSPGTGDLRSSGLRTPRFRGSFCSLVWHCASFVF